MKISEAFVEYRGYRQELVDLTRSTYKKYQEAQAKYEATGNEEDGETAATLKISAEAYDAAFKANQEVLDQLTEQHTAVMNAESAKAMADPETGYAAMMSKAMTTAMRMARGDHVPMEDEEKLREYNAKLYAQAKEAQLLAMKDDPEEYESLYDKEGGKYDPEGKADNTEAAIELPGRPEILGEVEQSAPEEG